MTETQTKVDARLDQIRDLINSLADDAECDARLAYGNALEAVADTPALLAQWAALYDLPVTDELMRGVRLAAQLVQDYPAEDLTK